MAAISPNWSPKKSFGQLEIFPNSSISSWLRLEPPLSSVEQKNRPTSSFRIFPSAMAALESEKQMLAVAFEQYLYSAFLPSVDEDIDKARLD